MLVLYSVTGIRCQHKFAINVALVRQFYEMELKN